MKHELVRSRRDPKLRRVALTARTQLTPGMLRLRFSGEAFADFVTLAPDDHVKLFIPTPDGAVARRDYTPRRFDPAARTLDIDFALHEAGPATRWALAASPGDALEIGGPRGSTLVPPTFDWMLLVGDETGLPAIGRRVEEAPAGARVTSLVAVAGPQEEQRFETAARHEAIWVHRPLRRADDPQPVLAALAGFTPPPGDGFVWVGAEARAARAVRDDLVSRGHPLAWIKAAGYWRKGVADAHEKLEA